jgi:hypothetical protein
MSGQIVSKLPSACGVSAVTCTETVGIRASDLQYRHAVTANWRKERKYIQPTTAAARNWMGVLFQLQKAKLPFAAALRDQAKQQRLVI